MEQLATFFIYIGCLLLVLLFSFIFEFDIFKCTWVAASALLAAYFATVICDDVF